MEKEGSGQDRVRLRMKGAVVSRGSKGGKKRNLLSDMTEMITIWAMIC